MIWLARADGEGSVLGERLNRSHDLNDAGLRSRVYDLIAWAG